MTDFTPVTRRTVRFGVTLSGILTVVLIAGYVVLQWFRPAKSDDPLNPLGFANLAPKVKYVGDQACAECHASIAKSYARTPMAQSWRSPQNAQPIEDYSQPHEVTAKQGGYRYQVYREGDRFFQRELYVDREGREVPGQVREVAFVLGSGTKGRSYVTNSNGYLTIMPVAWYSEASKWDLNPGYHADNQRFSREVVPKCIACHTSYPDYVPLSENRYREPLPEGIGCERCHGPGELHVKKRQLQQTAATGTLLDRTIVNPAKLPSSLQQDVCLQCHLSTKEGAVFYQGKEAFDYRPGQPLSKLHASFQQAGKAGEAFTAVSHGSRVVLSRCFTASGGELTCIRCHDAHMPVAEVPRSFFNSRCVTCHSSNACSRPSEATPDFDAAAHTANDCVACHMPRGAPTDISHTVLTDHWIRKRPRTQSGPAAGQPDSPFIPLEDFFHTAGLGEQGIAHVFYGVRSNHRANLTHGAELLQRAREQEPNNARWQYWLGYALKHQGKHTEAIGWMRQALDLVKDRKAPPLPEEEVLALHSQLAQLYFQLGKPERALEIGERLAEVAPNYVPVLELAAELNVALRHNESALQAARAGTQLNPAVPRLQWILGWKAFEVEDNSAAALASLKLATEMEPTELAPYLVLAEVYDRLNQGEDAEAVVRRALEFDGEFVPGMVTLADLLIRHGRPGDAVQLLEKVLDKLPGNSQARDLLKKARAKEQEAVKK